MTDPTETSASLSFEETVSRMRRLQQHDVFGTLPIGVPEWDLALWRAGREMLGNAGGRASPSAAAAQTGPNVFLGSTLLDLGGHTPLIGDIVRALDEPAHLVLTDIHGHHQHGLAASILGRTAIPADRVTIVSGPTLRDRGAAILNYLSTLRPRRVFLLQHPDDPLASLAAQPDIAPACWLVHHADSVPSFGLHIPGVRIIDLHERAADMSRLLGRRPWLLPLTAPDPGARPVPFLSRGQLVTASSGTANKFVPEDRYSYPETVGEVLRSTGGWHVHIGPLPAAVLDRIAAALSAQSVAPDRFTHVESVPSIARALWERGVDVYLASFPLDGARTRVEVLASGTPYVRYGWRPDGDADSADPSRDPDGTLVWRHVRDLVATLRDVNSVDALSALGASARAMYDARHHPDVFRERLRQVVHPNSRPEPRADDVLPPRAAQWLLRRLVAAAPKDIERSAAEASALAVLSTMLRQQSETLHSQGEILQVNAANLSAHAARVSDLDARLFTVETRVAELNRQRRPLTRRLLARVRALSARGRRSSDDR